MSPHCAPHQNPVVGYSVTPKSSPRHLQSSLLSPQTLQPLICFCFNSFDIFRIFIWIVSYNMKSFASGSFTQACFRGSPVWLQEFVFIAECLSMESVTPLCWFTSVNICHTGFIILISLEVCIFGPFGVGCLHSVPLSPILQGVFTKNRNILSHNHSILSQSGKLALMKYFYLICDPCSKSSVISVIPYIESSSSWPLNRDLIQGHIPQVMSF